MKLLMFLGMGILFSKIISAQNADRQYFYYYYDEKIPLTLSKEKLFVKFKSSASLQQRKDALLAEKLHWSEREDEDLHRRVCADVFFENSREEHEIKDVLRRLNENPAIASAMPYFRTGAEEDGVSIGSEIAVKLKSSVSLEEFKKIAETFRVKIQGRYQYDEFTYFLGAEGSVWDGLQAANQLFETGKFVFAQPTFQNPPSLDAAPVNDPQYPSQWGHNNANDVDINVPETWSITTGCNSVKVAIIDQGVDLTHVDLVGNLVQGFDATKIISNGGGISGPEEGHGTPCAGIIAAIANNNQGIAGIAYNSRVMPIVGWNVYYEPDQNNLSFSQRIANAVDWAWQNGASVLSNSWSWGWSPDALMTDAFNRAHTKGRGGLGCIIVASSGNDSNTSAIRFPALLPNVISVGAIDSQGNRFSYSNYSKDLDVTAPSSVRSTFRYNNYGTFTGTSAACPHVAGVAALVLSVNPTLKASEAKTIIESTCKKLPNYTYTSQESYANGTWNTETGYGMVDAFEAVKKAGTIYIQNKSISASIYRGVFIHAGSNVTQTLPQGLVTTVENTATGYLVAHGSIFLKPGVHIKSGSKFLAKIDPTMYKDQCVAQNLPPVPIINPNPPSDLITLSDKSDAKTVSNEQESDLSEVFSVYPNPFGDELSMHFETEGGPVSFVLRDAAGRSFTLLENKTFARGRHTLRPDISQLPPGVYIYTFSEGARNRSGKLLKRR